MARYFIRFADTAGGAQSPAALFRREMRDSIASDATIGPGGWQLTDELPSLLRAADSAGLREVTRERAMEFEQDIIAASSRSARGWAVQAGWSVAYFPGGAAGEAAARHYARAADASCRRTHVLWAAGRLQVKVRITDEGHLEFSGQDLNVRGEVSEYEYVLTVKPSDLPKVTAALGGPPGADVIELLVASAEMIIRTGELSWLRSLGIEPGFWSHAG